MSVTERPDHFHVEPPRGTHTHLEPFAVFEAGSSPRKSPLVILNTPLQELDLEALWEHSSVQVCADGGANRLFEYFEESAARERRIPTYITGDCDSLRDDVKEYYVARGATLIPQYSQYSSDFMKAFKVVLLHESAAGKRALQGPIEQESGLSDLVQDLVTAGPAARRHETTVHVAGGIGGRFDQTVQLINQMYAMRKTYPWLHLVFFAAQDVIFLAPSGTTYVSYSNRAVFNTKDTVPKCGLLPFGRETVLSTRGLRYDVSAWPSAIGADVSSSNGVCGTTGFVVESSQDIVVNVEVSRERAREPPRLWRPSNTIN